MITSIDAYRLQMLQFLVDGDSIDTIAKKLGYSVGYVKQKFAEMYEEYEVHSDRQLAVFALRKGLAK